MIDWYFPLASETWIQQRLTGCRSMIIAKRTADPQVCWRLGPCRPTSLNPSCGALGYNTEHSDHWTWRAVQIPSGHLGPVLTEPRLCHQSQPTSRIFRGNKSINSWLHNCSMATVKKNTAKPFFSACLQHSPLPVTQRKYWNKIKGWRFGWKNTWFEMNWDQISKRDANRGMSHTFLRFQDWFSPWKLREQKKHKIKCLFFPPLLTQKCRSLVCPPASLSPDTQLGISPVS